MSDASAGTNWSDDRLSRQREAADLIHFLTNRMNERRERGITRSYVLNLDSGWGHGKSFFLTRLGDDLRAAGHAVAFVNAWESDFSDNPLLAILSSIEKGLQPFFRKRTALKTAWRATLSSGTTLAVSLVRNVAAKAATKYTGEFVSEAIDIIDRAHDVEKTTPEAEDKNDVLSSVGEGVAQGIEKLSDRALDKLLAAFKEQEASIRSFREGISVLSRSLGDDKRIFILVDELDRCRPAYAIKLLEAAKHLFDSDGVIFLVATDTSQLVESVKAIYGSGFDSQKYLYRFFDRTYRFREPDRTDFVSFLFQRYGLKTNELPVPGDLTPSGFLSLCSDAFNLSLRDIEQCFDVLATVSSLWDNEAQLQLGYLWPLIVFYHLGRLDEFNVVARRRGQLTQEMMGNPTVAREWQVGGQRGERREVKFGARDLLSEFMSAAGRPLIEILNDNNGGKLKSWVREQIRAEAFKLHGGTLSWTPPLPMSRLGKYPEFVELAIRFEAEAGAA